MVSQGDQEQAAHLAYLADRKVDTAKARPKPVSPRINVRSWLNSATASRLTLVRRGGHGQDQAAYGCAETDTAKDQVAMARAEQDSARIAAAQQTEELQRQIDELQAKPTDRGLVLTLGDVLFTTGMSHPNAGATGSLDKLAAFLIHYPEKKRSHRGLYGQRGQRGLQRRPVTASSRCSEVLFDGARHRLDAALRRGKGRKPAGREQ